MTEGAAVDRALAEEIAAWLRTYLEMTGAERFVLGLSGGIDSALVCALCREAAGPDAVLGAIMPSHSATLDAEHARLVASTFGVTAVEIDLTPATEALLAALPGLSDPAVAEDDGTAARVRLATANIRPRLRMTTLYALANRYNGLVVGTGNKTEARLGYFTKYGDGGVDLLPIADLYKYEVRALARALGVPDVIIDKAPSAGLWPGQTDESELGATYADLDAVFTAMDAGLPIENRALHERVLRLERNAAHKRSPAPAFRRSRTGAGQPGGAPRLRAQGWAGPGEAERRTARTGGPAPRAQPVRHSSPVSRFVGGIRARHRVGAGRGAEPANRCGKTCSSRWSVRGMVPARDCSVPDHRDSRSSCQSVRRNTSARCCASFGWQPG